MGLLCPLSLACPRESGQKEKDTRGGDCGFPLPETPPFETPKGGTAAAVPPFDDPLRDAPLGGGIQGGRLRFPLWPFQLGEGLGRGKKAESSPSQACFLFFPLSLCTSKEKMERLFFTGQARESGQRKSLHTQRKWNVISCTKQRPEETPGAVRCPKSCYSEPARTLAWESVLLFTENTDCRDQSADWSRNDRGKGTMLPKQRPEETPGAVVIQFQIPNSEFITAPRVRPARGGTKRLRRRTA